MKNIKVLFNNNTMVFKDLEWAKEVAKRYTMVGGKATVYEDNKKVVTYYNGEEM
jgi:hypothetical protein